MHVRAAALFLISALSLSAFADGGTCSVNLDFTKRYLASDESVRLCDAYSDKVLLIVNTASYCGFTSQFEGLEALQKKYADRGFSVLGFPSNDFFQDPRSEEKIREFCDLTYEVKFPMFEKSKVAKRHAEPLYEALGKEAGQFPKWNFHKYLLDKQGHVVGSFGPTVAPDNGELIAKIESLL
ncbi:MAG: glutathione peroxidase [Arenicellales bacterium]|jgi:glutathione peroxidase|nr:glutathione peroxidase [Gammaproteobacteria bacterium]